MKILASWLASDTLGIKRDGVKGRFGAGWVGQIRNGRDWFARAGRGHGSFLLSNRSGSRGDDVTCRASFSERVFLVMHGCAKQLAPVNGQRRLMFENASTRL